MIATMSKHPLSHVKEKEEKFFLTMRTLSIYSPSSQKSTQNGKDLSIRPETKLMEWNLGMKPFEVGLGNYFLDMTLKLKALKKKMGLHQTKKLPHNKGNNEQ